MSRIKETARRARLPKADLDRLDPTALGTLLDVPSIILEDLKTVSEPPISLVRSAWADRKT